MIIKMTQKEKDILFSCKNGYNSFSYFMEREVLGQKTSMLFGLSSEIHFDKLSEEELMWAWLRPEYVEVVK